MNTIIVFAVLAVLAFAISFGASQIPSGDRAVRTAENNAGLENAHVVHRGYSWGVLGGCHEDDLTKFKVQGTRNGRSVTVEVCAPLIGGYTVRG